MGQLQQLPLYYMGHEEYVWFCGSIQNIKTPHSLLSFIHTESIFSLNNLWNSMILQQSSFTYWYFFSISWHVMPVVNYCHTQAPAIMPYKEREMQWFNRIKEGRTERRMDRWNLDESSQTAHYKFPFNVIKYISVLCSSKLKKSSGISGRSVANCYREILISFRSVCRFFW